ncbi:TadE/TadG family type IV pilus assembly protein [Paenibacillus macerans]|uniref:TadE/TadG family type IV pilus assembly protein n=1 Tax=Paenibacillus macerans TaxID=44252 RepID=UPI003D31CDE5
MSPSKRTFRINRRSWLFLYSLRHTYGLRGRRRRRIGVSRRRNSGNRDRGSIVLEAALVTPVFVLVLFWFIYMLHMTLLVNQLHTAASNAVKQVAAHMYPVALAATAQGSAQEQGSEPSQDPAGQGQGDAKTGTGSPFAWEMPGLSMEQWADQYADSLPSPLSDWVTEAARKGDEPLQELKNSAAESVLDPLVKPLLRPFLQGTLLEEEHLHVSRVAIPDLRTGKPPYFGLELSYELPISVPFTGRKAVLQTRAEERLWIGDTGELNSADGEGDGQPGQAAVILSKPDPAYAGHRAAIKARIAPGTTAKLTVYYKSGVSQAKYLGEAAADDEGIVTWNWLVGGNTTPGTWSFVIETGNGSRTTAQFEVASPK